MKNKVLKKIVGLFGYKIISKDHFKNQRLVSRNNYLKIENILESLFQKKKISYLIQIGANDGKRFDILNHFVTTHRIDSLLVEPIVDNFNSLKKNYSNFNFVKIENSAISQKDEILNLYKVRETMIDHYEKKYGNHIRGISSFYKKHLIKHGIKRSHIDKENVKTLTALELVQKHNILNFDLLFIDAEGYDANIAIDFLENTKFRPIIILEYIHIKKEKFKNLIELLELNNFIYFIIDENLICFPEEKRDLINFFK